MSDSELLKKIHCLFLMNEYEGVQCPIICAFIEKTLGVKNYDEDDARLGEEYLEKAFQSYSPDRPGPSFNELGIAKF